MHFHSQLPVITACRSRKSQTSVLFLQANNVCTEFCYDISLNSMHSLLIWQFFCALNNISARRNLFHNLRTGIHYCININLYHLVVCLYRCKLLKLLVACVRQISSCPSESHPSCGVA